MHPTTHLRRTLAAALAALVAVTAFGGPTVPAGAQTAPKLAGMVTDLTWYISRADMDRSVAMMRDAGVKWVRANVNWSSVEPTTRGTLDSWWLAEIDYAVSKLQAAGIQVLMPIADGVPYWASADPAKYTDGAGKHWNRYWKPANFADYADFARRIVTRYAARGVHHYEVWNEPNYSRFWPSGPSPADYTALLKAAAPAIRQADPSAQIVMGGLSLSDYAFLQGMYAAGAAPYFDIAAVHPYTGKVDPNLCWYASGTTRFAKESFCGIAEVRNTMVANGDTSPLWLTELGWSTSTAANGVSEATQATYLTAAYAKLASYPYVTNAFWYAFRNLYWGANAPGDLEANYGLVRIDFTAKPALAAFRTYTGGAADVTKPVLSSVRATSIGRTSAVAAWTTNEAATSVVERWPAASPAAVTRTTVAGVRTSHSVTMSGLAPGTAYRFRVISADPAGNAVTSAIVPFTTLP